MDYRAFSSTIKERLVEGGASGAFFFFSSGETFIAKSCTSEELQNLRDNAKVYSDYMVEEPGTYITRVG